MAEKPLGNLFVRVGADVRNFVDGMGKVDTRSRKTKGVLGGLTKTLGPLGLALGAVELVRFAKDTLAMGVAAEETASKFATVFGDAADSTQDFIDNFANAAGLTSTAAQEIVATTGQIAQGMGFAEEASAKFAQQATILAGDLASFNDVPIAETSRAIQSALTGERESLKRLGIVIKEVDVQARAMATSGKTNAAALTQQEKAAATFALIAERAGVAVGDLARTQDSAANASRRLKAQLGDIQVTVGQALTPVFSKFLELVSAGFKKLQLGAIALVGTIARFKLWWAKTFGDDSDFKVALDNMHFASVAMREMREELDNKLIPALDLTDAGFEDVGSSVQGVSDELGEMVARPMRLAIQQFPVLANVGAVSLKAIEFGADAAHQSMVGLERQMFNTIDALNAAARAASGLIDIFKSDASFLSKLGGVLQVAGGIVGLFNPVVGGALALGGGLLKGFEHGGNIASGTVGVVGEAGPELVSGPATVTPMQAGGDIVINIVTESGRKLVDTIRVKTKRDSDMRRVIRVPVAAVATG